MSTNNPQVDPKDFRLWWETAMMGKGAKGLFKPVKYHVYKHLEAITLQGFEKEFYDSKFYKENKATVMSMLSFVLAYSFYVKEHLPDES